MTPARTEAALGAAEARRAPRGGFRGYRFNTEDRARALEARRAAAVARDARLAPLLAELRAAGFVSLRAVASELNRRGVPAPWGGRWHAATVLRTTRRVLASR